MTRNFRHGAATVRERLSQSGDRFAELVNFRISEVEAQSQVDGTGLRRASRQAKGGRIHRGADVGDRNVIEGVAGVDAQLNLLARFSDAERASHAGAERGTEEAGNGVAAGIAVLASGRERECRQVEVGVAVDRQASGLRAAGTEGRRAASVGKVAGDARGERRAAGGVEVAAELPAFEQFARHALAAEESTSTAHGRCRGVADGKVVALIEGGEAAFQTQVLVPLRDGSTA